MRASWKIPYALALVLGLIYIALIPMQPYPFSWLLKMAPMLIYALLVWRLVKGVAGQCLALGFIAAALGDFFLDYGQRDGLFIQALLAFLVNQWLFAAGFYRLSGGVWHWPRSVPVLIYSVLLALWIVPMATGLYVPVAIYLLSLLVMGLCAARVEPRVGPLWLGAMLFVLADSLIGINKFASAFAHSTLIIVSVYFSGQSLIAWGLLKRATRSS